MGLKTNLFTIILSLFLLTNSILSQEKGIVYGKVVDAKSGESLLGVNIFLQGTTLGAASDLDGEYIIKNIPIGEYSIIYSMVGFEKKIISNAIIEKRKSLKLDIALSEETFETTEVIITAKAITSSEAGLLVKRQKSNSISDAVGSEQIGKSGGSNAAEAVKQITGASVFNGEDVFVRGLGDRYTSTNLNGAQIPSVDPYKQNSSIDIIPSSMIDNVQVVKSFTPDKRGDFSGGIVDIETKSFPDRFTLAITSKASSINGLTFSENGLAAEASSTDWLGMDDGKRALPSFLKNTTYVANPGGASQDSEIAAEMDKVTNAFNPEMAPHKYTVPLNQDYALSYGDQYTLFGNTLGVIASVSYKNGFSGYTDGEINRWTRGVIDPTKSQLDNTYSMSDTKVTNNVLWTTMAKISYKLDNQNIITLNSQFNQNGESVSRYLSGSYPYDLDPEWLYEARTIQYKERSLESYQLNGEHRFADFFDGNFDWRLSYQKSLQNDPDTRFFYNFMTDDSVYGIKTNLMPERYFRTTDEDQIEFQSDFTIPFHQWSDLNSAFKIGGFLSQKQRTFIERRFSYQPTSKIGTYFRNENGDIDALFSENYLGWVRTDTLANGTIQNILPIYIQETDQSSNNYDGESNIYAGYAMIDLGILSNLRMIAGARIENTRMQTFSAEDNSIIGEIKTSDVLPSFNLIYTPLENLNIRFSYGKTLARPTFREISPFTSYDFNGGDTYIGNPALERTTIDNLDLRFEWFIKAGEIVAISGYYKEFKNPIEVMIQDAVNSVLTWTNVDKAKVMGLEFETRKKLDFIHPYFNDFTLGGNFSYIFSEVQIPESELLVLRAYDPEAKDIRPFTGQSPYLINVFLGYDNYDAGFSSNLYFNAFGERLFALGSVGAPDVYEKSFNLLNFSASQRISENFSISIGVKNILDDSITQIQEFKGTEYIYNNHFNGRSYDFGLKFNL